MKQIQENLEDPKKPNIILVAIIKAVGIFSKAIQTFMGDEKLYEYLGKLIDVSEIKIIKEFED